MSIYNAPLIFCFNDIGKIVERKKMASTFVPPSYHPISTPNPALVGRIGCADWLVNQKDTRGS